MDKINGAKRDTLRALGSLPFMAAGVASAQGTKSARADAPRIALVLGSGSARGFAHIGVIKALEAAKIKPDLPSRTRFRTSAASP